MKNLISRERLSLNKATISMLNAPNNEHLTNAGRLAHKDTGFPPDTESCVLCNSVYICDTFQCLLIQ